MIFHLGERRRNCRLDRGLGDEKQFGVIAVKVSLEEVEQAARLADETRTGQFRIQVVVDAVERTDCDPMLGLKGQRHSGNARRARRIED